MKLKHLLILVFVLISAAPLFFGLNYLNKQSGQYSREQYSLHLEAMSSLAKKRIITAIDRIHDSTSLISSRTQMRVSLAQWNQSADTLNQEKINKIINDAQHGLKHIHSISIYDKVGSIVTSTSLTPVTAQLDLSKAAKGAIALMAELDDILVEAHKPLLLNHDLVGFIQIKYYTDFITELIKDRTGLGTTGEWLFAVRHESGDALFAVPLKYDHQAGLKRRVAKERHDVPITQAMLGNERMMSYAPDYLEQPVMASTRYIAELDWGLVAKVNESEVNQFINQNETYIYIAEFLIVVMSIVVGITMAFFISRPIEKLSQYTAKIRGGSLEEPPTDIGSSWREATTLMEHFAFMIAALRELNENLQAKVDERTQELSEANKQLEKLSTTDSLTGLFNRRYFDAQFQSEFNRAKRYDHELVVVMLDLDHFKLVNDTYGHSAGDKVLIKIALYLRAAIRESDVVARIGGEEFCLLLPESSVSASIAFLERIRCDIAAIKFTVNDKSFNVTCSFGVASLDESSETKEALLQNADQALYKAKQSGRNKVYQFPIVKNDINTN